jgi:membrane-bound acyltransferase YfiQ involved in biofilm formation
MNYTYFNDNVAGPQVLLNLFQFFWNLVINGVLFNPYFWLTAGIGLILYFIIRFAGTSPEYKNARYD